MAFKDSHQKIKKVINYTRKVTSYACIVFLVLIAIFFIIDYFIESRVAKSKGESYIPRFLCTQLLVQVWYLPLMFMMLFLM